MRERAVLSYGHRFRQRWQDVEISVFDGVTPGYATRDVRAIWGHFVQLMVTILHGIESTPEEVRWFISKYNLKRIDKIYAWLVINV